MSRVYSVYDGDCPFSIHISISWSQKLQSVLNRAEMERYSPFSKSKGIGDQLAAWRQYFTRGSFLRKNFQGVFFTRGYLWQSVSIFPGWGRGGGIFYWVIFRKDFTGVFLGRAISDAEEFRAGVLFWGEGIFGWLIFGGLFYKQGFFCGRELGISKGRYFPQGYLTGGGCSFQIYFSERIFSSVIYQGVNICHQKRVNVGIFYKYSKDGPCARPLSNYQSVYIKLTIHGFFFVFFYK